MEKQEKEKRIELFAVVLLLLLLLITGVATYSTYVQSKTEAETVVYNDFLKEEQQINFEFKRLLEQYSSELFFTRSFFDASNVVDRNEWKIFTENDVERFGRALEAIEFVRRVEPENLAQFEQNTQSDPLRAVLGYPEFFVYPETPTPEYYVVDYVEPVEGNEQAVGFNLFSNLSRKETIEIAKDTNDIAITKPITLVQNNNVATIMMLPVYKGTYETHESRQENITGILASVINLDQLLNETHQNIGIDTNFKIRLYDATENEKNVILEHTLKNYDVNAHHVFTEVSRVSFGTRILELEISKSIEGNVNIVPTVAVLLIGILISVLLYLAFWNSFRLRKRAEELAESLTKKLKTRADELEAVNAEIRSFSEKAEAARKEALERAGEAERLNKITVERELKMVELKEELETYKKKYEN